VIAHLCEEFIVVLWYVLAMEERLHVFYECHCGEVGWAEIVDIGEEVFVELALVTRVILGD
jgi:hypothetical protein